MNFSIFIGSSCFVSIHDKDNLYHFNLNLVHKRARPKPSYLHDYFTGEFLTCSLGVFTKRELKSINFEDFDLAETPIYLENFPLRKKYKVKKYMQAVHDYIKNNLNIENNYEKVIISFPNVNVGFGVQDWECIAKGKEYIVNNLSNTNYLLHQYSQTFSAYWQSPFYEFKNPVTIISSDEGGDYFAFSGMRFDHNRNVSYHREFPYNLGHLYTKFPSNFKEMKTTNPLDVYKKFIDLSEYGEPYEKKNLKKFQLFKEFSTDIEKSMGFHFHVGAEREFIRHTRAKQVTQNYNHGRNFYQAKKKAEQSRFDTVLQNKFNKISNLKEDETFYVAKATQHAIENVFYEIIKMLNTYHKIENLIICGSIAENRLLQEHIIKKFPNINLYVPPKFSDDGLSIGSMYFYSGNKKHKPVKVMGVPVSDLKTINNYKYQNSSVREIISSLSKRKIISILEGDTENGIRSILCDAELPVKNILNEQFRNNELYRSIPCVFIEKYKKKYFSNLVVHKEQRQKFSDIISPENRINVKFISENDNVFLYNIIHQLEKVLVCLPMNKENKPQINTIEEAMNVLRKTCVEELFVVLDNNIVKMKI